MQSFATNDICNMRSIKLRQSSKIQRLGETLIAAGFVTLDDQAKVLGVYQEALRGQFCEVRIRARVYQPLPSIA